MKRRSGDQQCICRNNLIRNVLGASGFKKKLKTLWCFFKNIKNEETYKKLKYIFYKSILYNIFSREQAGEQQALLAHTIDPIRFRTDASIFIEVSMMSVLLTINVITFYADGSFGIETSVMTVLFPMAVLCNAIPAIPIHSAHPMWYMIHIFPTAPVPLPLEGLLGC